MPIRVRKKKKTNRLHKDIVAQQKRILRACVNLGVFAAVLVLSGAGVAKLRDPATLPLNSVQIRGEFRKVSETELQAAVDMQSLSGFFNTDVESVRTRVKALPWVEDVAVRRIWPDRITVTVIEQEAVAQWGNDALLNARGELFMPDKKSFPEGLPRLNGPEGSAVFVLARFYEMRDMLFALERDIRSLTLDERRAWWLELDNGVQVALGRNDRIERLQRFNQVYSKLFSENVNRIKRIDLRYTNGLAVLWKEHESNAAISSGAKVEHVEKT